jgi:hypothetical protein
LNQRPPALSKPHLDPPRTINLEIGLSNYNRRRLYEHGRNALLAELRALRPPLSDAVIAKERLAFEEAIRKVEAEEAQRANESN